MSAKMSLRDRGRRKKVMFSATVLDMQVFGRGRCRDVGRNAALSKCPVNSEAL
jgi:hypothetical protein